MLKDIAMVWTIVACLAAAVGVSAYLQRNEDSARAKCDARGGAYLLLQDGRRVCVDRKGLV